MSRSATSILTEIRDGAAVNELSEAIHEAVQAVKQHGKPAKVTLDVTIAPLRKGTEHLVDAPMGFTAEVSSKLPKPDPDVSIFFVDGDGNPTRNQPERQTSLGLSVARPAGQE